MEQSRFFQLGLQALEIFGLLMALFIGILVVWVLWMYLVDSRQTTHTVRRNYPVIGRLRYKLEDMGTFLRQYFFAMDREEMPFNRAQRAWVYRAAKNVDSTIPFGSTRPLNRPGDVIFLNCQFPTLSEAVHTPSSISIGEGFARKPYSTSALVNISAMSYGAISIPAVKALSTGAKEAGIWLNTGEGGLSPYHLEGGCDLVFQIGTAKYGVRDEFGKLSDDKLKAVAEYPQVRMIEIKLSQGAKPGKGGILPGEKVTEEIAQIRGIPIAKDSISPNGHPDIRCIDDLLDMIVHIRTLTGLPTGFKTVMGDTEWLDELCIRIHARGLDSAPDFITLDSADGGTGAAPQSLMDYVGLPIKRSLPMLVDKLIAENLKDRIRVICSGKLIDPAEVAWAIAMGADFVNTARGFMFALGCIQALQCNKNTCPTGITTHNVDLQKGLDPFEKSMRVANFVRNLHKEVSIIAHSCGVDQPRGLSRRHVQIINSVGLPEPIENFSPSSLPKERRIPIREVTSTSE